jgi:phosphatidylserine/phosphatidylglycerophosphate/cardiolipin synthase-like enzyme
MLPFMNGGPEGEHWNKSVNGFYDWIDNKSKERILGIELGFKADNYGLEVSSKLIQRKKLNPDIDINILIDGFVSILMQKPPSTLAGFELNTIKMIDDMRGAGINVYNKDSWNPLSMDFLAANHIKLWLFDATVAFFGGIGIESQFRTLLYDEMDLVQGPFVRILTMMALLLMINQKGHADVHNNTKQLYQMTSEEIERAYLKNLSEQGDINMRISLNVPGYIQDAQKDYVDLLLRKDIDDIHIMAPYFSDHKVARSLVIAANRLHKKLADEKMSQLYIDRPDKFSKKEIAQVVHKELENSKKIHVIFPKKQENRIIAEVSKYYAYYLRDNPIVETRQFYAEVNSEKFEMLHAKQMIVVLRDQSKNWTKYVKFGGSYNPAGRAQNMWELNAIMYNGTWSESDDSSDSSIKENPIKNYLDKVMKAVVTKYSEPFPWGSFDIQISLLERINMGIARLLWF